MEFVNNVGRLCNTAYKLYKTYTEFQPLLETFVRSLKVYQPLCNDLRVFNLPRDVLDALNGQILQGVELVETIKREAHGVKGAVKIVARYTAEVNKLKDIINEHMEIIRSYQVKVINQTNATANDTNVWVRKNNFILRKLMAMMQQKKLTAPVGEASASVEAMVETGAEEETGADEIEVEEETEADEIGAEETGVEEEIGVKTKLEGVCSAGIKPQSNPPPRKLDWNFMRLQV